MTVFKMVGESVKFLHLDYLLHREKVGEDILYEAIATGKWIVKKMG